jgi:anthranilate phosphoribosyltransferase
VSVREALAVAVRGEPVPAALLEAAFGEMVEGRAATAPTAALLAALRTRGETVEEIVAAARALRARAVTTAAADPRTVDTCGTGGDGANTFNVSTVAAFVVAGAGVPVAKHGNRAASSRTGSFDLLEELGVRIDLPVEACGRILARIGIGVFFARTAHPAFRHLAPLRSELGVHTLLNCLGPLLNPAGVRYQLVGVYARSLVESLAGALGALGAQRALVVHGSDGLDELTTTGPSFAAWMEAGRVESFEVDPIRLGVPRARREELAGGDARCNAEIARSVLAGEAGAPRDVVLLNAAGALWVAGAARDLAGGLALARQSVDSGAAKAKLDALVEASRAEGRAGAA